MLGSCLLPLGLDNRPVAMSNPEAATASLPSVVVPGQFITNDSSFMRGHGTQQIGSSLVSTVAGRIDRINRLICVSVSKTRYAGDVGDVVIGRVAQIAHRKWRVDLHSRNDASLALAAFNLPDGQIRKRQEEDELCMRQSLTEGDVLCAEVQQVHADGSVALHTRNQKYGKLQKGTLHIVRASLLGRARSSFLRDLLWAPGVEIVFGLNGAVWIGLQRPDEKETEPAECTKAMRQLIATIGNCVVFLNRNSTPINESSLKALVSILQSHPDLDLLRCDASQVASVLLLVKDLCSGGDD